MPYPVYCCFGVLVMGCLFIAGVFVMTNLAMRSSDAYQLALAAAQREPSVTAALGVPVRAAWLTTGEISVASSNRRASLEIPIWSPPLRDDRRARHQVRRQVDL